MKHLIFGLLCLLTVAANAQKISELPVATGKGTGSFIPIVQGGVSKKILIDSIVSGLGTSSGGFVKQTLTDAATITINQASGNNLYKIASLAATRTIVLSNTIDNDFGAIIIGATNGFKLISNGTTLNLPASGSTSLSYIVDGANVIWEITPTTTVATSGGGGGTAYDANAQTYFTAIEVTNLTPLTVPEKTKYNQMVVDLKAAGLYTKFTHLGTSIGGNASSHAVDAITGANQLTYTPTVDHTYAGMDPSAAGTAGFINTNILATSINPLNFSLFIKLTENTVGEFNSADFGRFDDAAVKRFAFSAKSGGGDLIFYYTNGAIIAPNVDAIGLYAVTSQNATDLRVYKNNALFTSSVSDRSAVINPSGTLLMGTGDENIYKSNRNIGFYALATGMTDAQILQAQIIISTFLAP